MKILIIDDKQVNLDAAKEQFSDHELTLCNDYCSAEQLLTQTHQKSTEKDVYAGHKYILGEPNFDMVLTDLFMPYSPIGNGGINNDMEDVREKYKDQQQPYGFIFILVALRRGIKYLGLHSIQNGADNHHGNPIQWALDLLRYTYDKNGESVDNGKPFQIGSTKMIVAVEGDVIYGPARKNWKNLFEALTA